MYKLEIEQDSFPLPFPPSSKRGNAVRSLSFPALRIIRFGGTREKITRVTTTRLRSLRLVSSWIVSYSRVYFASNITPRILRLTYLLTAFGDYSTCLREKRRKIISFRRKRVVFFRKSRLFSRRVYHRRFRSTRGRKDSDY